jgi:ferric-dicitrate binding protein FerR (iron transport regulator)
MERERIQYLFDVYKKQTATEKELAEFSELLHDTRYEETFNDILDASWTEITAQDLEQTEFPGYNDVLSSIKKERNKFSGRRNRWYRIVAAAAVVLLVFSAGLIFIRTPEKAAQIQFTNDIAPGTNGATLTLADGRKILINDSIKGPIADEDGLKIYRNKDGQLIYEIAGEASKVLTYHTLTTTRGEQIQVRLPDQTLVFLNAESSLRFPTSFANTQRRVVTLDGEGYFEVSKDKNHPFVVQNLQQEIEVLGTSFNVNAYSDESDIKTTLLEGSVRITNLNSKSYAVLSPGQQAIVNKDELTTRTVQTEDVVAWKNGYFMFNNESLASIMKRVSKWYKMDVIYKDEHIKQRKFFGAISRYQNISELLKVLQKTEVATFKIEGRQVIISSE